MEDAVAFQDIVWSNTVCDAEAKRRVTTLPTLHQLRVFWAVARSATLTAAAKQLGLTQPSLSQQLGKLETTVGSRLFHRRHNEMELTEAGRYLLPHVEHILRILNEVEEGLARFRDGYQPVVKVAGINSVLRSVLSVAVNQMQTRFPDVSYDIQESAPADILELLYTRRINIGLLAANSLGQSHTLFRQVPIMEDPYVLVVPRSLPLDNIADPVRELSSRHLAVLNRSIQFVFGSRHTNQVAEWYDRLLPEHRVVAQCRSFETAIDFVRAGTGVCIAPALATISPHGPVPDIKRYRINVQPRRVVALTLAQNSRVEPVASLLGGLQEAGAACTIPGLQEPPPFLAGMLEGAPS